MSGRATAAGVVFQARVGAFLAGLILADRPLSRLGVGLPGSPRRLLFETPGAVDDMVVESDVGRAYIQAKRTVTLSSLLGSELGSAADQFVRQYRDGVVENGNRRGLHPSTDRLILAVGEEAAGTVTTDLREALDRNRSGAATGWPAKLSHALATWTSVLRAAWREVLGTAMSDADLKALLDLCAVVVSGPAERHLIEDILRDVVTAPGSEAALIAALENWAADAAARGVGGDATSIRRDLLGRAALAVAPNFKMDVERLRAHSAHVIKRLERFTRLPAPEGPITIDRPVAGIVAQAARGGSLLVTGEPGAGKSAVLHAVAVALAQEAHTVVLTVEADSVSLTSLRDELKLQHSFVDVLQEFDGRPAYLILDALDAARGGAAEATYRKLVESVMALPGWTVLASVRSFDIKLGREWRRLFVGTPCDEGHAERGLPAVRHVHVSVLTESEKAQVTDQSPQLGAAIEAAGARMQALACNSFNLALLAELLTGGASAASLASVSTRGQLLERYWDERMVELGLLATVGLKAVVEKMVARRAVDMPETAVPMQAAPTVEELLRRGVLITEQNHRIAFRHHVLFDYAVARLLLLPEEDASLAMLAKGRGAGLLISPSLGYWIEEVKHKLSPTAFWTLIAALVSDADKDPIIRVEAARIAVQSVSATESLAPLRLVLEKEDNNGAAFTQLAAALLTNLSSNRPLQPVPWALLLGEMTQIACSQMGSMRALIRALLDVPSSAAVASALGRASRTLFDAIGADAALIRWLSPSVTQFVASTFATDVQASRARLEALLESERFAKLGHVEIPRLAQKIAPIAEADGEFALRVFERVFSGGDFSRDEVTSMNDSWILSLRSNAAQDFKMAEHSLSTAFPGLLEAHPLIAVRAFGVVMKAIHQRSPASHREQVIERLSLGNGSDYAFERDYSYSWAWDIDEDCHDDYAKIYRSFVDWVKGADEILLADIIPLVVETTGIALVWRALFEAGSLRPAALAAQLWSAATSRHAISYLETRTQSIAFVAAAYPFVSRKDRLAFERACIEWDLPGSHETNPIRDRILATVFEAIGEANIISDEARLHLTEAKIAGGSFPNDKPFSIKTGWVDSGRHWLQLEGVDIQAPTVAAVLQPCNAVKHAQEALEGDETRENFDALFRLSTSLDDAIGTICDNLSPHVDQEVSDRLAEALGVLVASPFISSEQRGFGIARLLELTHHPYPQLRDDTEADFAKFASWGSPSPRLRAARSLAEVVGKPGIWPEIRVRFEKILLSDPHPAVRFQLAAHLGHLRGTDEAAMWDLFEKFVAIERNTSVIQAGVTALWHLKYVDPLRVEKIILALPRRREQARKIDDDTTRSIVFFALNRNLPASNAEIRRWIADYVVEEDCLMAMLFDVRSALTLSYDTPTQHGQALRERTYVMLWHLIDRLEPAVISWPQRGGDPTAAELSALKLFNEIADQFFFAAGAYGDLPDELRSHGAQRLFLRDAAPIISKLTTLGTPAAVHHLLELIERLLSADPELCFDLFSEAILRTTGVARYQYESMGADKFVTLVGLYMADHRVVFEDETRRAKLIECIAVFVEAGWPEARRLFQNLPDLLG